MVSEESVSCCQFLAYVGHISLFVVGVFTVFDHEIREV